MKRVDARRAMALLGTVLVAGAALAGPATAVSNLAVTGLTNGEVTGGTAVEHTLTVEVDDVSADGNPDTVYVTLADTYAGNASFSTVAFRNRTTGATVPISSSTSVVDGPDGDGVQETLRTKVSNDADHASDDINATYQFSLTHPAVTETTTYDVTVNVTDSSTGTAGTTVTDAITVTPGTTTADGTTDDVSMTTTDGATDGTGETAGGEDASGTTTTGTTAGTETTDGSGPGFGVAVAVLAALAVAVLARS